MSFTIEEKIKEAEEIKHHFTLGIALAQLKNTPNFKLIVDEYTKTHALSLIKERTRLVKDGVSADNLQQQIDATGLFLDFLEQLEANYEYSRDLLANQTEEE